MAPKGKGKGKKKEKGNPKKTKNRAPEPNSDSKLKPEIISDILSRLSVKTLLRFRCVCKQWRKLISKSDFIAAHFCHSSSLQRNDSPIIIQTYSNQYSILRYNLKQLVELDFPYPCFSLPMSIAGPVNGILCIFRPILGDVLTLWNPAMSMSKKVKPSKTKNLKDMTFVSVGLAFDSQKNDLLILRIFSERTLSRTVLSKATFEVCPMKSPLGWQELKSDIYFYIDRDSCDAIFKGEPYWLIYITPTFIVGKYEALLRFKVRNMELDWYPLPYAGAGDYNMKLTTFEESLGLLTWEGRNSYYVDVWEGNIEEDDWNMICRVRVYGIERILGCLRNGDIVAENGDGMLWFYTSSEVLFQKDKQTYPRLFPDMSIVGPANGYFCLFHPTWSDEITLWNQPEGQFSMVKIPETEFLQEVPHVASVGLAFDSQKNDLLILRIFCSSTVPYHVEIKILRPLKSLLIWKNLKSNMRFRIDCRYTCDVIFKGEPYWLAYTRRTPLFGQHDGLVRFDVGEMEFHWLSMPSITAGYYSKELVTFEYSLGMLIWEERDKYYIDVWIMDDEEYNWSKNYRVGPLSGIDSFMGSLRSGDIAAEKYSGMPIRLDPVVCSVKTRLDLTDTVKGSHVIFDCPESLLLIEGMAPVKEQNMSEYKRLLRESEDFMETP